MPKISKKAIEIPESPIRKLVPYAEQAKLTGKKVYHLNIGQPDIKTPDNVLNKIKNLNKEIIEYSHSAGYESYRQKLTEYYKSIGVDVSKDEIMITTGGSEALIFAMQVCMNDGDEIIIPEPFYTNYNSFSISTNVVIKPIITNIENNFGLPPIEEFEKLITPKTKAILICNPNNPTGYIYSEEELNTLKSIVLKYDLFLFSDEVYREFAYDGFKSKSVLEYDDLKENAIVIDSVSKRYSMCGARIGAIVTRNREIINSSLKFGQARLSPPTFGQIASEEAINTPKEYFTNVLTEYQKRRDTVINRLEKIEGVKFGKPKGAFYIMVELPIKDSEDFCKWLLSDFSYNDETVMLAPANGFYSSEESGKNQVRIAYVLNQEELEKAMDCLEEALKVYNNK